MLAKPPTAICPNGVTRVAEISPTTAKQLTGVFLPLSPPHIVATRILRLGASPFTDLILFASAITAIRKGPSTLFRAFKRRTA